jgi:hypothetical protein
MEVEDDSDMASWGPPDSEGERGESVSVRYGSNWAVGHFLAWAKTLPHGPFFLFFVLLFSYFLFSKPFISFAK